MPSAAANENFRALPSVDELLRSDTGLWAVGDAGQSFAAKAGREVIAELRAEIAGGGHAAEGKEQLADLASTRLRHRVIADRMIGIRRAINATGVVIHTNLGRAPLSDTARLAIAQAAGYSTVEYDTGSGTRGRRGQRAENLAAEITGAEDAVVVNNCAAAAFFILSAFAAGGEVVVSRGELVEIGGDFRIPDVLAASGATLREVGTTNRTKIGDYERAIGPGARMLLRVHPSNYRIVGFTAKPSLDELVSLASSSEILLYEDIGSGSIAADGVTGEPAVLESIRAGVDIVSFSGDKLLGGPQAGIIAGKKDLVGRLRKHPLYRILRADKITYAALEATLEAYRQERSRDVPVQRMLALSPEELEARAKNLIERYLAAAASDALSIEIAAGNSAVGGGAAPGVELPTSLLLLRHAGLTASKIGYKFRTRATPVIARIADDRVAIDLRTVDPSEEDELLSALISI